MAKKQKPSKPLLPAMPPVFRVDLYHHDEPSASATLELLYKILAQQRSLGDRIMSKLDEMNDELVQINQQTNDMATTSAEISSDMDDLIAKLAAGGLTAEEADAVKAKLAELKGTLGTLQSGLTDIAAKHTV